MSEPADQVDGLYLSKVIRAGVEERTTRAAPGWLSEHAIDPVTNKPVLSPSSASELITQPRKGWLNVPTIRGIAAALGWRHDAIYVPNAISVGLHAPSTGGSVFAAMLPGWIDQLPASVQMNLREQITLHGRAHGLTD